MGVDGGLTEWACVCGGYAEKLVLVLRDGRKLIGVLRSWDQFGIHHLPLPHPPPSSSSLFSTPSFPPSHALQIRANRHGRGNSKSSPARHNRTHLYRRSLRRRPAWDLPRTGGECPLTWGSGMCPFPFPPPSPSPHHPPPFTPLHTSPPIPNHPKHHQEPPIHSFSPPEYPDAWLTARTLAHLRTPKDLDRDDSIPSPYRKTSPEEVHTLTRQEQQSNKRKENVRVKRLRREGFEGEHCGEVLF